MPLRTTVKVSHISNLSDARYCAGMGVEMLGFAVIPEVENYMPPQAFQEIRGWISGPRIIAELYGISAAAQIDTVLKTYAPDYFELTSADYHTFRDFLHLPCIVHLAQCDELRALQDKENISYIIMDGETTCAAIAADSLPVLVKVNSLGDLQLREAEGCFSGYVLEGPKELRPGVTSYDQLGAVLEALEED
jgi:phosphoribosylanthranilate isomerase